MTAKVPVAERRAVFKKLLALQENRVGCGVVLRLYHAICYLRGVHPLVQVCFDCPQKKPMWASSTFGVFICLDCAGGQRRLGTHLTFARLQRSQLTQHRHVDTWDAQVRSVDMDEWTEEQLEAMKLGGNKRVRLAISDYERRSRSQARLYFRDNGMSDLHQRQDLKYQSMTAKTYKSKLQREVQTSLANRSGVEKAETEAQVSTTSTNDKDGKGLDRLLTSFQSKATTLEKTDTPTRATSAPELSEYGNEVSESAPPPTAQERKDELAVKQEEQRKPPKPAPAPKGTLSAGMLLGGPNAKLPAATPSVVGRRAFRGSANSRRTMCARRLDDDVDFNEPIISKKPPAPSGEKGEKFFDAIEPSDRLVAAYLESTDQQSKPPPAPAHSNGHSTNGKGTSTSANGKTLKAAGGNGAVTNDQTATARFGTAKGIGSDAFFGREEPQQPAPTAARFAGSTGIGSDAFFNDGKSDSNNFTGQLKGAASALASTIERFR